IEPYATGGKTNAESTDPVFSCPSDHSSYGYNETGVYPDPIPPSPSGDLGLGGADVAGAFPGPPTRIPLREARVIVPSDMIAVGDLGLRFKDGHIISISERIGFDSTASFASSQAEQDVVDVTKKRHGSKANMVFCDGHVEGLRFPGLYMNQDQQLQ